jgi:hypothetical protein
MIPIARVNVLDLVDAEGTPFFVGFDPFHGYALWKSNGTSEGTVPIWQSASAMLR